MKLIKPTFEILEQEAGLEGIYKQIEKVGRTCYKSENLIKEGSAKPFVDRMIESKHLAMCEHGTVYLNLPFYIPCEDYVDNPYSKVEWHENGHYVTTNMRVLVENDLLDDLKYLCEPTEHHVKRVTVKFTCDRGVSHEFVRHKILCVA